MLIPYSADLYLCVILILLLLMDSDQPGKGQKAYTAELSSAVLSAHLYAILTRIAFPVSRAIA